MSNRRRKLLCFASSLILMMLLSVSVLAGAKPKDSIADVRPTAASMDVETTLSALRRELSVAVLAQAQDPDAARATAQRLRGQGFALWAMSPNRQQRDRVLEQMQGWGMLGQLPGWNPQAELPQFSTPSLPPAPDKAWLEANTNVGNPSQPLVVHFWAQWCGPCRKELPQLARFYEEQYLALQAAGIELITVNNDPIFDPVHSADVAASVKQLPVLHDPEFRLYRQLAQTHDVALPATFFLQPGQPRRVLAYGPMAWLAPGVAQELQKLAQQE